jgi:tyrosine-protein kinase Etk/Wzc
MALSENAELEELIRRTTTGAEAAPPVSGGTGNDDAEEGGLDLSTLVMVARKSLPWVGLLLLLGLTASWLYLRYTKPVYKATSVLKIDERSDASTIGLGAVMASNMESSQASQLAGEVEFIKSGITYKQLKRVVPLDVNYYTQGTVLEAELFGTSPFRVEYTISDQLYYNRKFNVSYVSADTYRLSVEVAGETLGGTYKIGQPVQLPGIQLRLLATSSALTGSNYSEEAYHFTILDDSTINSYLDKKLTTEVLNAGANTIQISFQDYNRLKAQRIVNALDSVYRDAKVARKQESTAKALAYLDQQLAATGNSLSNAEDNLKSFVQRNGTYDAKGELTAITEKLPEIQKERMELEQKLTLLNEVARLASQERLTVNDDLTVAQAVPALAGLDNPAISTQLEELNNLQQNLRRIRRSYEDVTEAVKQPRAMVAFAQQSLQRQIQQAQLQLRTQINVLNGEQAKLSGQLQALPGKETELERLKRPLELYGSTYQMLLEKKVEYNIKNAGTTADFQILSPAYAPDVPISPIKLLVYAIGLAGGLLLSLGLIATRYLMHNTITGVNELERSTKASVLGVIPTYEKEKLNVSRLVVDKNPKSSVSEAIRSIRTNLDFISPSNKKRLISVTSTISGEGKTFVTVNLAGIIALSGQRVIILDLDMRKPKVNLAFDAENVRGISTILIDRHSVAECVQHTSIESLDFISAGPTPPNPSELILHPRFDQMLEELYRTYDVILIDTPPVGLVTDGILIMRKADVPIYIVRANYSRKSFLKNMNRLMQNNQFTRMCTILNDAKAEGSYGYGYGYGYGSYGMGYYEEPVQKPTLGQRIKGLFS